MAEKIKHCPYCGEEIMATAKKCKHCGEWLVEKEFRNEVSAVEPNITATTEHVHKKDDDDNWITIIGTLILAFIRESWVYILILVFAAIFVPDEASHIKSIQNDVVDCIKNKTNNWLGNLGGSELGGLASMLIDTDVAKDNILKSFNQENEIVVHKHWFWSTGTLVNRDHPEGTNVSFGMFGFVIPYVSWDDFVLLDGNETSSSPKNSSSKVEKQSNKVQSEKISRTVIEDRKYAGDISGIKCHFQLFFENRENSDQQEVYGTYYYDKNGADRTISLRGSYNRLTDALSLVEYYDNGTPNATIEVQKSGNDFSGRFERPDGKVFPITMTYYN